MYLPLTLIFFFFCNCSKIEGFFSHNKSTIALMVTLRPGTLEPEHSNVVSLPLGILQAICSMRWHFTGICSSFSVADKRDSGEKGSIVTHGYRLHRRHHWGWGSRSRDSKQLDTSTVKRVEFKLLSDQLVHSFNPLPTGWWHPQWPDLFISINVIK